MSSRQLKTVAWLLAIASCCCHQSCPALGQVRLSEDSRAMLRNLQERSSSPADKTSHGSQNGDHGVDLSAYLRSIGEPSTLRLRDGESAHAYRLIWIAFPASKIVVVRLQIDKDGTAKIYAKQTRFGEATLLLNQENSVSTEGVSGFLDCMKRAEFWELPVQEAIEPKIFDGTHWYLEGVRDGHHHFLYRRSPESKPSSLTDIGRYLAKDLARLPDSIILIPRADRSEPLRRNSRE